MAATTLLCKGVPDEEQLNKIFARYLEYCNVKENVGKSAKFSYNYENHTIIVRLDRVKTIEFNIYDFAEWDRQKYFNNVCYDTG
ncbi:MAG TPA: hypothetical protein VI033_03360 [Candidatus Nitrosopolaris sp.]|jgi:hypothetical protein